MTTHRWLRAARHRLACLGVLVVALAMVMGPAAAALATDRPAPRATAPSAPRPTIPSAPIVDLQLRDDGDGIVAIARNALAGPVQVRLSSTRAGLPAGHPALPARATVPALGQAVLWRAADAQDAQPRAADLQLQAVPGDPSARPRDVEYGYPLGNRSLQVTQGYGGAYSHDDVANLHAVDLAAAEGTPVLAARAGTVMQVEARFDRAGHDAVSDGERANFVRIVHDDGSMALYAHLARDGVLVHVGQPVRRGERIGTSGNTGFSNGPHLHFVVQVNRGFALASIPVRMVGPQGLLKFDLPPAVPLQPGGASL